MISQSLPGGNHSSVTDSPIIDGGAVDSAISIEPNQTVIRNNTVAEHQANHETGSRISKDAFMTDSIQLIGLIYKFSKMRNIPAQDFEQIIIRSYEVARDLHSKDKNGQNKQQQLPDLMKEIKRLNQENGGAANMRNFQQDAMPNATVDAINSYGLV